MPDVYTELDLRAEALFGANQGLAVVIIKNHMIQHNEASFPGLWLLGMFVELFYLKTGS
jgi:hypothetical protein